VSTHIRNELLTRERYRLVGSGKELPAHLCAAWCERDATSQWFYMSLDHAALAADGSPDACPTCVTKAIIALAWRGGERGWVEIEMPAQGPSR